MIRGYIERTLESVREVLNYNGGDNVTGPTVGPQDQYGTRSLDGAELGPGVLEEDDDGSDLNQPPADSWTEELG